MEILTLFSRIKWSPAVLIILWAMAASTLTNLVTRIRQRVKRYVSQPELSAKERMIKEILFYWTLMTLLGDAGTLILTIILDAYPMIIFSWTMGGFLILYPG